MKKGIFIVLIGAALAAAYFFTQKYQQAKLAELAAADSLAVEPIPEPTLLYGIPIDSFEVYEGKIKWGQSLSNILSDFAISNEQIYELANKTKDIFDVRLLKANYPFTIIHERDSSRRARQMIFEPDPTQYVVFNLADSIYAQKVEREVITEERTLIAKIEEGSNVSEALSNAGGPQLLVHRLVDIFAWQVSFFHIQPGDEFKVIYEEKRIGDQVIGVGEITGAYFKYWGKDFYAVHYEQGTESDYFDEDGNSLRKTFLKDPLDFKRISSSYSPKRFHPVQKRYKAHLGTDYAANPGTPIWSVGDGVVVEATYGKYNGNYVKIKHNSNYTTQYLHMQSIKRGIKAGSTVTQGQIIGYVGSTGLATGPHLCFRFWKNGRQVDSQRVELPPSEPIDPKKLNDFLHTKNVVVNKLRRIQQKKEEKKTILAQIPLNQ
ncbi:MAG: peptidase M23 [Flammeovirgaceae bacterium]|nr:peptidase M23 [Flammeovirgaceae bacterium]MBE62961.1 peptidase M23 [Flammeovirgaceae bacterium]MBR08805.1 peptidase M23 [Rickettsiales bacterium]HCX21997.1 peptidase M23 [Cytophagales bacterium]